MQVQRTHKLIYRFVFRWSFMGIPQGMSPLIQAHVRHDENRAADGDTQR